MDNSAPYSRDWQTQTGHLPVFVNKISLEHSISPFYRWLCAAFKLEQQPPGATTDIVGLTKPNLRTIWPVRGKVS